jgi:hypothetical protein
LGLPRRLRACSATFHGSVASPKLNPRCAEHTPRPEIHGPVRLPACATPCVDLGLSVTRSHTKSTLNTLLGKIQPLGSIFPASTVDSALVSIMLLHRSASQPFFMIPESLHASAFTVPPPALDLGVQSRPVIVRHVHEMHACKKMHAYEMHACKRCMPGRYTPVEMHAYEMHAWEMHAYEMPA